jgi:uncharacterized protein (TIRG00374 family)
MRRFLIGLVLSAGSLALLARLIHWSTTLHELAKANGWLIAAAVVCLLFSITMKTVRWQMLLPSDPDVSTARLFRILQISYLLNNVLPARLGDGARVAMTSRLPNMRVGHVLSSLLTERVTDFITLLTCFVAISPFLTVPSQYAIWERVAWYALGGIVAFAVLVIILRRFAGQITNYVPLPANERLREEARSFGNGVAQIFHHRRVIPIWGTSAIAWAGAFGINYALMHAMHIDAPATVAVLLTVTTNLAMLVPSSPGYVGIFHAVATLTLLPFGVDKAEALSFAIIAHLVNVLPVSILGAAFLIAGRDNVIVDWTSWRRTDPKAARPVTEKGPAEPAKKKPVSVSARD